MQGAETLARDLPLPCSYCPLGMRVFAPLVGIGDGLGRFRVAGWLKQSGNMPGKQVVVIRLSIIYHSVSRLPDRYKPYILANRVKSLILIRHG